MSDPPYYTACPNPFLEEFIRLNGKANDPTTDAYSREPFAADVSEGKNDPIYNAHSYHTKVPHKAIMRYILHYTEPGDLVFDGFCGTGMTGVAAQLCGDGPAVESLGYKVKPDGTILDADETPFAKLGTRYAILGDLSPAATFIAYNYNFPVDAAALRAESERLLSQVEADCGWMYVTLDSPKPAQITTAVALLKNHRAEFRLMGADLPWGRINYTVWSDVFVCSECSGDVVFFDSAVDKRSGDVRTEFTCPHCNARLTKRRIDRVFVTVRDPALNQTIRQAKQVPVLINYTVGKHRREKKPDDFDQALLGMILGEKPTAWFPMDRMPEGEESRRNDDVGITHVHHFYTHRSLLTFLELLQKAPSLQLRCALQGGYRVGLRTSTFLTVPWKQKTTGPMKPLTAGTLYIPSLSGEQNWLNIAESRTAAVLRSVASSSVTSGRCCVTTASSTASLITDDSIDYIFTDPPFGGNLIYSELNFINESWLRVRTNIAPEAIENKVQRRG